MSKGSGGSQTVNTDPWIGAQAEISNVLANNRSIFDSGLGFYTPRNANQQAGDQSALNYAGGRLPSMLDPYQNWSQTMLGRPGIDDNPYNTNTSMQQVLHPDASGYLGIGDQLKQNMGLFQNNSGATGQGIDANPYNINTAIQQGLVAPNSISSNPVLEQYAQAATRPLDQQLKLQKLPDIRSAFGGSQPGGGSRQGIAEGVAKGLTEQAIGDTRAGIFNNAYNQSLGQQANALSAATQNYGIGSDRQNTALSLANQNYGLGANTQLGGLGAANQAYGQGLDAQSKAMALYPQALQAGLMPSQIYSQVGGGQQADQNAAQTDIWDRMNAYAGIVNGVPIQGTGRQQTGGGSGSSSGMGALGGALGGASLANMIGSTAFGPGTAAILGGLLGMFSDERLKKDVTKIADLGPLDLYQWKWNDKASGLGLGGSGVGLLAQDVEKTFPEHVGERDGYKTVNYTGVFRALSGA